MRLLPLSEQHDVVFLAYARASHQPPVPFLHKQQTGICMLTKKLIPVLKLNRHSDQGPGGEIYAINKEERNA